MLCKKHVIEECNSSDCESCNLEAENEELKEILHSCKAYQSFMVKTLVDKMDKIFTTEDVANSLNEYSEWKIREMD